MNCVFVNVTDKSSLEARRVCLTKEINFTELLIPLSLLNKRVFENGTGVLGKIKSHFLDKKILSKIKTKDKEIVNGDKLYVLPRVLEKADKKSALSSIKCYIQELLSKNDFKLYNYTGCIKENIDKYLSDALQKIKKEKENTRLFLVYNTQDNVDLTLLESLIMEYKTADVFVKNIEGKQIKEKIDSLNARYGSSICVKSRVTKQEIKTNPYDICVYMEKADFKIAGVHKIYLWDSDADKFDKYALLANELGVLNEVNRDSFSYMTKNYSRLNILSLLSKATLDNKPKIM